VGGVERHSDPGMFTMAMLRDTKEIIHITVKYVGWDF